MPPGPGPASEAVSRASWTRKGRLWDHFRSPKQPSGAPKLSRVPRSEPPRAGKRGVSSGRVRITPSRGTRPGLKSGTSWGWAQSGTLERAAPTAADPKETLCPKPVAGCSATRAEVGAVSSFGFRRCRWMPLGTPRSAPRDQFCTPKWR